MFFEWVGYTRCLNINVSHVFDHRKGSPVYASATA